MLVLALLLAASLLREAGAESFATSLPMSTRVKFQRDDCFSGGDRTFSERYTYNADGSVQSITTTCRGGDENGRQCINTADTINCTKPLMPGSPSKTFDLLGDGALQH